MTTDLKFVPCPEVVEDTFMDMTIYKIGTYDLNGVPLFEVKKFSEPVRVNDDEDDEDTESNPPKVRISYGLYSHDTKVLRPSWNTELADLNAVQACAETALVSIKDLWSELDTLFAGHASPSPELGARMFNRGPVVKKGQIALLAYTRQPDEIRACAIYSGRRGSKTMLSHLHGAGNFTVCPVTGIGKIHGAQVQVVMTTSADKVDRIKGYQDLLHEANQYWSTLTGGQ